MSLPEDLYNFVEQERSSQAHQADRSKVIQAAIEFYRQNLKEAREFAKKLNERGEGKIKKARGQ